METRLEPSISALLIAQCREAAQVEAWVAFLSDIPMSWVAA